ncbi:MAG: glycosylase [Lachnospiraceae bacterium]|nr:glycosylase [Lachnospiraceae bacterium]
MTEWLKRAVFYEIYPQSFRDSNGDGIGDFNGIIEKLDYIKGLGCNAIWMNPCYDSPFRDAGYDVRDYKKVASRYGTEEELCRLFEEVHARGMHILLDLVPGHTSEEHPWFRESAKEERNEYSGRYIWTDNWFQRAEGFPYIAGECERNGAYILNYFKCQPALNYGFLEPKETWQKPLDHPDCLATRAAMIDIMCYWLEKGCDGFRVDMADSLVKNDDADKSGTCLVWSDMIARVHKKYPDASFVSEWNNPAAAIGKAGFQMDFFLDWFGNGYNLLMRDYDDSGRDDSFFRQDSRRSILDFLEEYMPKYEKIKDKGLYCLITGNHDMIRAAYNLKERELKLAYAFLFTMPGAPFLYYGDEIGMRYQKLPCREGGYTRTGSRTPMQWDQSANCGFSAAEREALYLPVEQGVDIPTVAAQEERADSLLHTVRDILAIRGKYADFADHANLEIVSASDGQRSFAYRRGSLLMLCNPSGVRETLVVDNMEQRSWEKLYEIGAGTWQGNSCLLEGQSFVILSGR